MMSRAQDFSGQNGSCVMDESSSPPPGGDAELIGAIASGDSAAYGTLYERHVAAARSLARQLVASPAEAEDVVTETFTRLYAVLRQGGGPGAAVRPYLLTAVRRVASERSGGPLAEAAPSHAGAPAAGAPAGYAGAPAAGAPAGQAGAPAAKAEMRAGQAEAASLGEPLFSDPATAELESEPMARAFGSLPGRQRAVLWHTVIEQADPGPAAVVLGVTADGIAELREQARADLSRAYLKLYLSGLTREDCRSAAAKLDLHLSRAGRRPNEGRVQRHLRGCRDCRAAAVELVGLDRSLRRVVAPIVLGPATQAYLAAAAAAAGPAAGARAGSPAPAAGRAAAAAGAWAVGGLSRVRQAPARIRQAPRQRQALAAGGVLLAASAATGLTLTLAANTSPPHGAPNPAAAAAASPSPAVAVPLPLPAPSRTRPGATPAPVQSPIPVSSASMVPASAASPAPSPLPDHHHHRHHHHHPDQVVSEP
jgi:DNA-directed RNA polymerase specialized sigma24 family protein